MEKEILLTVFTPTYNRAHTLPRTYQSLRNQDDYCFEWLIIDDGSTDDTKNIVHSWVEKEKKFKIRYIYKSNGGMHTAYNIAYRNIKTELNVCIDSDDCLAKNAAKKIVETWESIRSKNYAGIIGLDSDMNGEIIGSKFPENLLETTYSTYYGKLGGKGDKKFVYRTDIMHKYPEYPEFEGENYVGIACKFAIIDQDYKMYAMNEVLCNVEYQIDGSTNTMYTQYLKNPKGFAYNRKIMMKYSISKRRLIMETIHYISSSIISQNRRFIIESPNKTLTILLIPVGWLLTEYIKLKSGEKLWGN